MKRLMSFVIAISLVLSFGCGGSEPPSAQMPVLDADEEMDTGLGVGDEGISPSRVRGATQDKSRREGAVVRVKELRISPAVEVQTNEAIKASSSFRKGIRKLHASFYLSGLEEGNTIRVLWYKDENLIEEYDIECEGEKRYALKLADKKNIKVGDYNVEVEVLDEVYAGRSFQVGGDSISPAVDRALLGTRKSSNQMPNKPITVFKSGTKAIHCGVRFLGLPDVAKIEIEWVFFGEQGEDSLNLSEKEVEGGGNKNVGVTWNPKEELKPGLYKAVIRLSGNKMDELPFTVE